MQSSPEQKLTLHVKNLSRQTCTIEVTKNATCADLKIMAHYALKYPNFKELIKDEQYEAFSSSNISSHFRLICNSKELKEDENTLGSYGIKNNDKLAMIPTMGQLRETMHIICVADNLKVTIDIEHTCSNVKELKSVLSKLFSIPCADLYFRKHSKNGSEEVEFSKLEDNALCIPFLAIYAKFSGEINPEIKKDDSCRGFFEKLSGASVKTIERTADIKFNFTDTVDTIKLPTNVAFPKSSPLKTSIKTSLITGALAVLFTSLSTAYLFGSKPIMAETALHSIIPPVISNYISVGTFGTVLGGLLGLIASYFSSSKDNDPNTPTQQKI